MEAVLPYMYIAFPKRKNKHLFLTANVKVLLTFDIGTVFEVDGTSFNKTPSTDQYYENVTGTVMNKNTIEDFKSIDKAALLNSVGEIVWANIKQKTWITSPGVLLNFIILSFADLKKYHYYYWFAFPAPSQPTVYVKSNQDITTQFSDKEIEALSQEYKSLDPAQKCFFALCKENDNICVRSLSEVLNSEKVDVSSTYFVFEDPSAGENPGWPLRMFLAALLDHSPSLAGSELQIIGLRCKQNGAVDSSRVFGIRIPQNVQGVESAGWVGWERNDKGNFGPKLANMSASMDPIKLADTSSDLNIRLMKWRLVPDIDVEVMKKTKCLLLGAGTLGCHVARDLLAWGFRHITFIDSGKVSFSNPTRQVLFNYEDCLNGGKKKAIAAADNLKLILPTVNTKGIVAHIPMPGHPIGESLKEETITNINTIIDAIADHDVIFLLLDTREARWLPTLIGAHYGKIVINAALGFDSYLVIRHGFGASCDDTPQEGSSIHAVSVPGSQLGCYFCNDVTAPGNSLRDRTLDQQCTVTRPGGAAIAGALAVEVLVAMLQHPMTTLDQQCTVTRPGGTAIAGALAVEVLVAMLQHPMRANAPAICNATEDLPPNTQGVLGSVPHSIRGFLHSYETVLPTCTKFKQCIACSENVIKLYREEGIEFLLKVFNSGTYLEEVTGLAELHLAAEMTDILTFSDEDEMTE
ncbi:thiF family domain-containing protein [Phthorimaea operculella]|nr:thiF family domain-containing protein [Phthorimaea operculella]